MKIKITYEYKDGVCRAFAFDAGNTCLYFAEAFNYEDARKAVIEEVKIILSKYKTPPPDETIEVEI